MRPPATIDGASVVAWTWRDEEPFGYVCSTDGRMAFAIHAIALCRYEADGPIHRFSCRHDWDVVQDSTASTLDEAKQEAEQLYHAQITWHSEPAQRL